MKVSMREVTEFKGQAPGYTFLLRVSVGGLTLTMTPNNKGTVVMLTGSQVRVLAEVLNAMEEAQENG